jgi:hypothetical protein
MLTSAMSAAPATYDVRRRPAAMGMPGEVNVRVTTLAGLV